MKEYRKQKLLDDFSNLFNYIKDFVKKPYDPKNDREMLSKLTAMTRFHKYGQFLALEFLVPFLSLFINYRLSSAVKKSKFREALIEIYKDGHIKLEGNKFHLGNLTHMPDWTGKWRGGHWTPEFSSLVKTLNEQTYQIPMFKQTTFAFKAGDRLDAEIESEIVENKKTFNGGFITLNQEALNYLKNCRKEK